MKLGRFAMAWLAGVGLGAVGLTQVFPFLFAFGLGAAVTLAASRRSSAAALTLVLMACAFAGLWRNETARPPQHPTGIVLLNDGPAVRISGTVIDHPEERGRSQRFTLRVDSLLLESGDLPTHGSVQVTARPFPRFEYGDRLTIEGELLTPPSDGRFDYREYLARRGVVSLAVFPRIERTGSGGGSWYVRALDSVRRPLSDALLQALPEPEASLARGMLLGERASIPPDLNDDFNTAGISHLVAISGSNVMLVMGLLLAALVPSLGVRRARWAIFLIIPLFGLLVGMSWPVLRATVMAEVALIALISGRPLSGVRSILLTTAIFTAFDPRALEDVSFLLSFSATAGIVLLSVPLQHFMSEKLGRRLPGSLAYFLAASMSPTLVASLFVLPVTAYFFGRVSIVALPANLLAGITFPIILATSAVTALAGAVSNDLGAVAGSVAVLPLSALIAIGRFSAGVPGAAVGFSIGFPVVIAFYVALAAATRYLLPRLRALYFDDQPDEDGTTVRRRPRPWQPAPVLLASFVLFAAGGFGLLSTAMESHDRLVVSVLDVGQGDAILIQTPRGQRILVDGGPSGSRLLQALGRELPDDARRFDLVVLTHGQDDHVTGLIDVLDRYEVRNVLASPLPGTSAAYRAWLDALSWERAMVVEAVAGEWFDLGDRLRLEVIGPPPQLLHGTDDDVNNSSVVLRLVYGDVSFLLTGDLAADGEEALLRSGADLRADVLKVGHHGSDASTTPDFLTAVRPSYAAISSGDDNTYGHPSPSTLLRLRDVPFARTDTNGRLRFETDGRHLWADLDRGAFRHIALETPVAAPSR